MGAAVTAATSTIVRRRVGPKQHVAKREESLISQKQREIHRAYCDGETAQAIGVRLGLARTTVWEAIQRVHRANRDARLAKVARGELP